MASLIPIPTTRVGDYFIRQRLVRQVQGDQLDLFRLQTQVSTGRRIIRPSDDAPAALRAISLQRTIQRKEQAARNLEGSRSVLGTADTSLNTVTDELNRVRGLALESVSNLTSESNRNAAIAAIDAALEALTISGNANYTGRYLFGGSRTGVAPFEQIDQFVKYIGNEKSLQNYVDLEQLFTTNIPGTEVFGGISGEVRGTADLNPHLTADTLLTSINGGEGIDTNAAISVSVTNGLGTTTSSIVDLSGAVTIGDVIRRIEANPPAGSSITVEIVNNGLTLTSTGAGTTIRVGEVAAGRAAAELGILTPAAAPASDTMAGSDLDPIVRKTTPLANLFGTKSSGRIVSAGSNNDLVLTAAVNGLTFDDVDVVFVDGAATVATYAPGTLTVQIASGATATDVAAAINAEGTFTAVPDTRDATSSAVAGTGTVVAATFNDVTTGGSGENLDTASGLILTNGGESVTLDVSSAETVEDLLNLISGAQIGLVANINAEGTGINVRSQLSGADFTIGENGGTTATQLGIRTYTGETLLADLNRGIGVPTNDLQDDLLDPFVDNLDVVPRDGVPLSINLSTATTLQDVVNLINNDPNNNDATTAVLAQLTPDGHGIELIDSSTDVTGQLVVQNTQAALYLGFLNVGAPTVSAGAADNYTLSSYRPSREDDLVIVARDGTELWIDTTGATTVQDVLDLINNHVRNNFGTTAVEARLAAVGNGIELVDTSTGTGDLTVRAAELSQSAQYLGFMPLDQTQASSTTGTLTSEDRNTFEVDSVFNSLIRLREALEDADSVAIGRAIERIDEDLNRVVFAQGEIGSRLQTLDVVETRLEDENVQLQSALSNEIDVDLVEAITNLTARQYTLQASLQTAANILNLSILDYI